MDDLEKVIRGLECCIKSISECQCADGCPYEDNCWGQNSEADDGDPMYLDLMRDALTLLKSQQERIAELEAAQTARLMTLEDVQASEDCMEPVFLEMLDENGKSGDTPDIFSWRFVKHITTITGSKIFVLNNTGFSSALYAETYNLSWRCWTSRPTAERREAVKWK